MYIGYDVVKKIEGALNYVCICIYIYIYIHVCVCVCVCVCVYDVVKKIQDLGNTLN